MTYVHILSEIYYWIIFSAMDKDTKNNVDVTAHPPQQITQLLLSAIIINCNYEINLISSKASRYTFSSFDRCHD